jgi:hypothetical protein
MAMAAGLWLRTGNSPSTADGSTLLARAVRQAPLGRLAGVPVPAGDIVHQSFEVTFAELPEGKQARQARADLFFERESARASAQWTDGAGLVLCTAVEVVESVPTLAAEAEQIDAEFGGGGLRGESDLGAILFT